jgi:hypothetical protein
MGWVNGKNFGIRDWIAAIQAAHKEKPPQRLDVDLCISWEAKQQL